MHETLVVAGMILVSVYSGGLWTVLLQRQVGAAFWFTLIIPSAVDAFGIFLFRQFALSVPNELLDAARVDGASEFRIFSSIVLPELGPPLATFGMLSFMFNWNAYLWPLIVLTEQNVRTLPIILTWYSNQHGSQPHLTMAASVLVIAPVLLVFMLTQRWIVKGITLTGIK